MKNRYDVILLHISRNAPKPPFIYIFSMWLFSIADYLHNNWVKVQIVNHWLEKFLDKGFSLLKYIEKTKPLLLAFSLQWHQQIYDTMAIIRKIKKTVPEIKIVVWWKTATIFSHEILNECKEIDFIIRWDGEWPMLWLSKYITGDTKDINNVPNLIYKDDQDNIIETDSYFEITNTIIKDISFSNFVLLKNYKKYLKIRQNTLYDNPEIVYFSVWRWCTWNCVFCAWSQWSEKKYKIRKNPFFYDIPYVIKELKNLNNNWITYRNSCFDPYPNNPYYFDLFSKIRKNRLKFNHIFDCFGLPSKEFIDSFSATFQKHSALNISPETWSEHLRKRIKSFYYDNESFFDTLKYISDKKINCSVYFSTWFPFETFDDILQTLKFISHIKLYYPYIRMFIYIIDLEPWSAVFEYQEKFWIKSSMKCFKDIIWLQKKKLSINYATKNFTTQQIHNNFDIIQKEINCKFLQSNFYTKLIKNKTQVDDTLNFAIKSCQNCQFFKDCFDKAVYKQYK